MSDKTELYILKGLITFDDYLSRFVDKIDHRFFSEKPMGMVFKATQLYFLKYSKKPTLEMLCDVMIPQMCDSYKKPEYISHCVELLQTVSLIKFEKEDYFDWLSEITKDYIQTKRIELALIDCVDLMDKGRKQEAIKKIIDASHVSFDETLEWCNLLNLKHVPILYEGVFDYEKIKEIFFNLDFEKNEGIVCRIRRGKAVRF